MPQNDLPYDTTLITMLESAAQMYPKKIGFTFLSSENSEETVTYKELSERVKTLASFLQHQGLTPGDRVLLMYPPGIDFIVGFFACAYANTIAVPIYPSFDEKVEHKNQLIVADCEPHFTLSFDEKYELGTSDDWQDPNVQPDTIAFLQYTSGSTGNPKAVVVSHKNLMHNLQLIAEQADTSPHSVGVFWLPPYHDMGLIGAILESLRSRGHCVLMSPFSFIKNPYFWLQTIEKYKANISAGPNFAYEYCTRKITDEQKKHLNLSSWRVAFNGAEPIRYETLQNFSSAFKQCGFREEVFFPCYGLAEATLFVSGGAANRPILTEKSKRLNIIRTKKLLSSELACDRVCIVDDNDSTQPSKTFVSSGTPAQHVRIVHPATCQPCSSQEIGEIWVNSSSVTQGYWNKKSLTTKTFAAQLKNIDHTDQDFEKKFLRTGDLGFICEGELYVTGRIKDVIIIHGRNYYPQDLEDAAASVSEHFYSGGLVAFSIESEQQENVVLAVEIDARKLAHSEGEDPPTDGTAVFEELARKIYQKIAIQYDIFVSNIVFIRTHKLPKTTSGKVQRQQTKNLFLNEKLPIIYSWNLSHLNTGQQTKQVFVPPTTDTQKALARIWNELLGISEVGLNDDFFLLGAHSLLAAHLASTIQRQFQVAVDVKAVFENPTLQGLAAYIEQAPKIENGDVKNSSMADTPQVLQAKAPPPESNLLPFSNHSRYVQWDLSKKDTAQHQQAMAFCRLEGVAALRQLTPNENSPLEVTYASFDYLNLAKDSRVIQAANDGATRYGTSSSASRMAGGSYPAHRKLEEEVAQTLGVEDAITFSAGYNANVAGICTVCEQGDLVILDELAHNSLVRGAQFSGAECLFFAHNNHEDLDNKLQTHRSSYRNVLIVTEGLFSMDGDYPSLPELIALKKKHQTMLMIDEAHSFGTLGPHGLGISTLFDIDPCDVDIWMGTTSKALAGCGGYLAGRKEMIEYFYHQANVFTFSTAMSPILACTSEKALQILKSDEGRDRCHQLKENSLYLRSLLLESGCQLFASQPGTAVVPVHIPGHPNQAIQLAKVLLENKIYAVPVVYPYIAKNASRIRFFIRQDHTKSQLEQTAKIVSSYLKQITTTP